ncbi:MAG: PhnD/SsuA/transferrin family substrate-binding protein [Gemmataceae bacterium]
MRTFTWRVLVVSGFLLIAGALCSHSEANPIRPSSRSLRIGVINTLAPGVPTSLLSLAMRPFRSYMDEQTGAGGEIVRGGDALALARSLQEGSVQIAIFHGHEFAWAQQQVSTLEPLVLCVNALRSVRAYVVVSHTATVKTLDDLRGNTVSLPRDAREHCRLFFERSCVPAGTTSTSFYRKIQRPAEGSDALEEVASGKAQIAIVDAITFEKYRQERPTRARLVQVVFQSDPFPPGVIAYDRKCLSADEVTRLRTALVQAHQSPRGRQSLQVLKLAGFEVAPAEFSQQLETIRTAYPMVPGR